MPADIPPPLLLLLHEGGWDEIAMVAIGLAVAYAVIMWTGRKRTVGTKLLRNAPGYGRLAALNPGPAGLPRGGSHLVAQGTSGHQRSR
jgi:hypothetical protein